MASAICVRCGRPKRRATTKCGACGLDPRGDDHTLAQSVILSTDRYEDGTDRKHYAVELVSIASRIQKGEPFRFDEEEVRGQMEVIELGRSLPWWVGWRAFLLVMLWLAPLWFIIAVGLWLFFRG